MTDSASTNARGHLVVEGLSKHFAVRATSVLEKLTKKTQWLRAVDEVSFTIAPGTTFGLVGESGCGKSTLGRAILRLLEPSSGRVTLDGNDVSGCSSQELFKLRRHMQVVFQDPFASLSPRRTIAQTLIEPLDTHKHLAPEQRMARVHELLKMVGLTPQVLNRYPHEFSGGQRQRVGIARALALDPALIVADEAVSALDVSVQSQVLNLMRDLQQKLGLSCLFIAHDLAVVQHISDVVGVMYLGKLVEVAPAEELFRNPQHPYTQALLAAVPVPDPAQRTKQAEAHDRLQGEVPSPLNPPSGCSFHPRCPHVMERCRQDVPATVLLDAASSAHQSAADASLSDATANAVSWLQPHQVSCHLIEGK